MNQESLGFYRLESGRERESAQRRRRSCVATGRHHHMKEHHVNTTDIELIDAVLSAPTGLHDLASDMADLAQREPTNNCCAHPSHTAAAE
jgi:hypothetical protein